MLLPWSGCSENSYLDYNFLETGRLWDFAPRLGLSPVSPTILLLRPHERNEGGASGRALAVGGYLVAVNLGSAALFWEDKRRACPRMAHPRVHPPAVGPHGRSSLPSALPSSSSAPILPLQRYERGGLESVTEALLARLPHCPLPLPQSQPHFALGLYADCKMVGRMGGWHGSDAGLQAQDPQAVVPGALLCGRGGQPGRHLPPHSDEARQADHGPTLCLSSRGTKGLSCIIICSIQEPTVQWWQSWQQLQL